MKNAKVPDNPDIQRCKGWDPSEAPWHKMTFGEDKAKSGEHALPHPPKKSGRIQGTEVTMLLLCAWTVYLLCKIIIGVIKKKQHC